MKIGRFLVDGQPQYGVVEGDTVRLLKGEPYEGIEYSGQSVALAQVKILAPCEPGKVVAVGLNYTDHIAEMGDRTPDDPVIFMKPATSVIAQGENIVRPKESQKVDYEAEVAAVISKKLKGVTAEEAKAGVLGFTILNDVTARDIQRKDEQWTRGKGYDTFAPTGPFIDTDFDPRKPMRIQAVLNGEVKQDSTTNLMIHDPYALIAFIARGMTLMPGDLVTTGTPSGVGAMLAGDVIEIVVEGVGSLKNPVVDE
jgi:2-keto-4-pentenoate hydratase/2-oxohepta-3-ene-1,7-dioic acid hydratase in catechol pathway